MNNLTEAGAKSLQSKIERYWRGRGYMGIKTWLEMMDRREVAPDEKGGKLCWFAVRSNIGKNGLPPRVAA